MSPDGTRLFVAYAPNFAARIDQISIPDAQLTPGVELAYEWGGFPAGLIVDGANHVLYVTTPDEANVTLEYFDAP